jgi:integrase/recombinase XerD
MREVDKPIYHMYDRDLRAEGKAPATLYGYWLAVSYLSNTLPEGVDLLTAGHDEISSWLAGLTASSSTRSCYMRRVRTFYYHMKTAGYLEGPHPMDGLARIKPDKTILPCPEVEEVTAVVAAMKGSDWYTLRDRAMIRIFLEAGTPRAGEMASITLDAVDLRHDRLTLKGKGGKERIIKLGSKSCRAITMWLRARGKLKAAARPGTKDLLFFSQRGAPLTRKTVHAIVQRRQRRAGVRPTGPHAFRRYTFDAWDAAGGNTGAAMQLWGWSTSTMPILYGEANAGRRAVEHAAEISLGDQIP